MGATDLKRSQLEYDDAVKVDYVKQISGFLFYITVFGVLIPLLVIKNNKINWLEGYLPNLDLIATVLGFRGGPFNSNIFRFLYNPTTSTSYGYYSQLTLNYIALLGATYLIAHYTLKSKSISNGWSRAFIMLLITYLLPSNYIAYGSDELGKYIDNLTGTTKYTYAAVVSIFLSVIVGLVFVEKTLIDILSPTIMKIIDGIINHVRRL